MAGSDITDRLSAADAAIRLGVSIETVKRKLKSGRIEGRRDNAGKWWVVLPRRAMAPPESAMAMPRYDTAKAVPYQPPEASPESPGVVSLADVRQLLGEQSDRLERQHNAAMMALQAAHRDAMAMLVERVDAAECRVEALLEQATRPWWARWLGASKRSDLG